MLRFPMTACPVIQDNSYPLVQDECPPVGEAVSRISLTHEATVMKTITRPAASSLVLVDRTSGFWDGAAESTLSLVQAASVLPIRFGVASNALSLVQGITVAGGCKHCRYAVHHIDSDTTFLHGNRVILVDAGTGAVQVTLPNPATMEGLFFHIKKIDTSLNYVTVITPGTETIDGSDEQVLSGPQDSMHITSDGTNWYIV